MNTSCPRANVISIILIGDVFYPVFPGFIDVGWCGLCWQEAAQAKFRTVFNNGVCLKLVVLLVVMDNKVQHRGLRKLEREWSIKKGFTEMI